VIARTCNAARKGGVDASTGASSRADDGGDGDDDGDDDDDDNGKFGEPPINAVVLCDVER
jgi:hypothetical protein